MKKILAFLLAVLMIFTAFTTLGLGSTENVATPTDLDPVPPIVDVTDPPG